ncbi:hypothetical protein GCM10010976_09210 [Bizionia arctica]|uniref:Fibronectin type-III domain-containing protein n=2 Tax=Bizionia arctica TaxID=1495645 RepID=A0A917GDA5_9FLAO|nr:hypothetical protein GCM10010976_09210 [Bizionia arctica]
MDKNRSLNFAFILSLFFLISGKGFAQLNESFDSGIPATWTLFGNPNANIDWSSTTDGYLGTDGVSINPSADNIGDQNTAEYFLVTPLISVPENGEIQFYTKQASEIDYGTEYQIRVSTAAQPDIDGFNIVLQSYTESDLNSGLQTEYEKKVVQLTGIPTGLNIYVAFVAINTQDGATPTGDEWFVDQVSILEGCVGVEDVTIESITVDSALVTWTHPTATNFEIQSVPTGFPPAASGSGVSGFSSELFGLDPETEFDIYIAAICDNGTQSAFEGPFTFETLKYGLSCAEPIIVPDISTTPYVFADNLANWVNPDEVYTTEGSGCIPGTGTTNYLMGDKVFFTYTPTQDGLITLTQTTYDDNNAETNCWNSLSSLLVYNSCEDVGVNCLAGTYTTQGSDPKSISNLEVQAGETYIIIVSSVFGSGAGLCFELVISGQECAPPADFGYNNLTENSVAYSWDNIGGFSNAWEYIAVPTGSGEPTGSGTPTSTNVDNAISGLTTATTYDLYVRSVCNGTPGIWSNPDTFTTQCTTFDTPYFTDFNDATNENPEPCWTTIDANGDGITWNFIGGWATTVTRTSRYENHDFYVSPRINFDGTPKRLRFKQNSTQGTSVVTIKLSTTGVGYDDFTIVALAPTSISNTNFEEFIVDLPDITGEVNVAWIIEPNTTETALRYSIDDVFIEDKPSCPDPLDPFAIIITDNSARFFWTPGGDETEWEVKVQDLDSGVPTTPGVLTDINTLYPATGLDSGNRYEFYVRAACGVDDLSQWVGPVPFTTLCTSYDTPFYESFNENDPDTKKFCWEVTGDNDGSPGWWIRETNVIYQGEGSDDYLISPKINLDGEKLLTFEVRADFSPFYSVARHGIEVLMSTTNTNPSSFSVISPLEIITNSGFETRSIIIDGNGPIYIAFRVPTELTGPVSTLTLDNVSIIDAPDCPDPTLLTVNTTSETTADLSWTPGYQETAWNIVVQPEGTGIPTTTGESTTTPNYTATDLTADTAYEFYVMADCDPEGSVWVGPMRFDTLCLPFTTPFVETFNYDSTSEDCWQTVNNNGDINWWEMNNVAYPYEGDQAAAISTQTNGASDDWLISPTITITENQRLRYYYRVTYDWRIEDLEVLLSTNGTGLDQFTTVLYDSGDDPVVINNVNYLVKIINLPDGIVGDINIAFHIPTYPPRDEGYRGAALILDNINIEDRPECAEPTNITFYNIIDTEVLVGWDTNGDETEWEISVQPSGTPAPVGNTDPNYLYSAPTNPFPVSGLTASTSYDVYVRAICDSSESEWTGPKELLTKCSFENLCQYTFILTSDYDISATLDITQNNQVVQSLDFEGEEDEEFTVFLCSGVEFSVLFSTLGSAQHQYDNYQFDILNEQGIVYQSPVGLPLGTIVYEGAAICGAISCPQPTDLTISATNVMSWTAGGSETQWEVAVQPLGNGTIPQSGTLVSTNSYTPTASDFIDPYATTYEYFVRAICGTDDESYWSGPFKFIRNDDVSTATTLPINSNEFCDLFAADVSFLGATASSETMSCDGDNAGDVWFNFTAESVIHIIEVNGFSGTFYYATGDEAYPDITMTLYKDNGAGNLEELACTYDKALVAMYSSELIVGEDYKLRLTLNSTIANSRKFKVCLRTPSDLCSVETVNGGFEDPLMDRTGSFLGFVTTQVITGWRSNLLLEEANSVIIWEDLSTSGFEPYEGGQCVQIRTDDDNLIDPNDPEVRGYYRDFDSSEITLFDFSYAHLGRSEDNSLQVVAGPPGGPYTVINENVAVRMAWTLVSGEYQVPAGQNSTRFIFRATTNDDIGNVIDAVNIVGNNEIITESFEVDCNDAVATVQANGAGTWIPSDSNPSLVTFADANSNSTTISGFLEPGVYTFTWKTSYCENDIEISYNGIADMPTVETPVQYCLNDTAQQLTATPTGSYTLLWYTQAVGGTGSTTAPTPDTSLIATTSYYVVNVDDNGCEGPRTEIEVIVSDSFTPELTFSYATTCIVIADNPMPSLTTGFATGGVFSSTTLTVDATTGEIDMASTTAGIHDIVYTFDGDTDACTLAGTYTATIEFTNAITPVTSFDYGTIPFCLLSSNSVLPNLTTGFTTGGVFSSTTLTVNATTGEIDLTSGTIGMHDVVYTLEADPTNCIDGSTSTTTIEIVETIVPETMFTYAQDLYCSDSGNILPDLATGFTAGGTFSAETGLNINSTTGEINTTTSTAGNYNITYVISEDLTNCLEGATSTFNITIQDTISPVTMFDYGTQSFCLLTGDTVLPNLAIGFTTGGIFSSTTITVDATTGEVDLTSATAGAHTVVYTIDADLANCTQAGTYTTPIEVVQVTSTVSGFTYADNVYCEDSTNVLPTLETGFTPGGVFSSETGLSINATTGEINISASAMGNYTIVYEIVEDLANCIEGSISSFDITILDEIEVSIEGACNDTEYWLTASPAGNSYDPNDVTYTWMDANGLVVGENSETFNVTEYANQNQNITAPTQFTVTVEFGSCSTTASFTTERLSCKNIPRGISPDGNGKNDNFDLTGYGVTHLEIFNRYGTTVFKFTGNYTNQWYGQSDKGKELPDGTYFYSLRKADGTSETGWVFINGPE